jgi:hypothetical protein
LPVVLVSSAQIVVEQFNNAPDDVQAHYLTLFGRSAWLAGSRHVGGSTYTTQWLHPASSPLDAKNQLIDRLWELGVLPNSVPVRFATVSGTWTELNPDNPPVFN